MFGDRADIETDFDRSVVLDQPIEPRGAPFHSKLALGIIVYLLYLVAALATEREARSRFLWTAESKLRSGSPAISALKAEVVRLNARSAMERWLPYQVYTGILLSLSIAAFLGGIVMGLVVALRARSRVPIFGIKLGALATILLGTAGFFALALPMYAAKWIWGQ